MPLDIYFAVADSEELANYKSFTDALAAADISYEESEDEDGNTVVTAEDEHEDKIHEILQALEIEEPPEDPDAPPEDKDDDEDDDKAAMEAAEAAIQSVLTGSDPSRIMDEVIR